MAVTPIQVMMLLPVDGLISSGQLCCLQLLADAPAMGSRLQVRCCLLQVDSPAGGSGRPPAGQGEVPSGPSLQVKSPAAGSDVPSDPRRHTATPAAVAAATAGRQAPGAAQARSHNLWMRSEEEQLADGTGRAGSRSLSRQPQAGAATGAVLAGTCSQQSCAESGSGARDAEQHLRPPAAAEPQGLLESETELDNKVSCNATAVCGCCGCQPVGLLPCTLPRPPAGPVCRFDPLFPAFNGPDQSVPLLGAEG